MSSVANGLCAACKPALATATSVKDKTRAPGPGTGTSRRSAAAAVGLSSSLQHNIFLTTMFRRTPFRKDGLEAYLEAPPLGTVEDSIEYWELRAQTDGEQHCPRAHAAVARAVDLRSVGIQCCCCAAVVYLAIRRSSRCRCARG